MKKAVIIISSIVVVALVGWQLYTSKYLAKTEQQPYTVVSSHGPLEIRHYPEAVMATVSTSDRTYKGAANRSFRVLAGYIFGGNSQNQSIAMTAPVHMHMSDTGSAMSFVMPASFTVGELPTPTDRGVKIEQVGARNVAALRFGGWASDEKLAEKTLELLDLINEMGLKPASAPWYMGYNPPFQVLNRRNEVAVQVEL